jgi:hypothetical protein
MLEKTFKSCNEFVVVSYSSEPINFFVDEVAGCKIKRFSERHQSLLTVFHRIIKKLFIHRRSKFATAFRSQLRICVRIGNVGLGAGELGAGGLGAGWLGHCPRGEGLPRSLVGGLPHNVWSRLGHLIGSYDTSTYHHLFTAVAPAPAPAPATAVAPAPAPSADRSENSITFPTRDCSQSGTMDCDGLLIRYHWDY